MPAEVHRVTIERGPSQGKEPRIINIEEQPSAAASVNVRHGERNLRPTAIIDRVGARILDIVGAKPAGETPRVISPYEAQSAQDAARGLPTILPEDGAREGAVRRYHLRNQPGINGPNQL